MEIIKREIIVVRQFSTILNTGRTNREASGRLEITQGREGFIFGSSTRMMMLEGKGEEANIGHWYSILQVELCHVDIALSYVSKGQFADQ